MTPFDVLENSPFSLNNNTPPPELLKNLPQENLNLPQYPSNNQSYTNPLTNPTSAGIHRDLLNYKNLYDEAEKAINFYGNYLRNGTDAEKNQAQGLINFFENQKREVSDAANMTRNTAKSLGIDTQGFDAENTLEEARQNMYTNDARAIQGLLNLKSVQSQQRDYYERMKNAGLSDRLARKAAAQKHDEFRENNVNQLFNGLQNYGINADGTMNQFGAMLLGKLTNENPQMVELFTNQFASPKVAYAEMNENQRLMEQLYQQELMKEQQLASAQAIAAADRNATYELEKAKMQNSNAKWSYEQQMKLQEQYLKSPEYLVESALKMGKLLYGDDEQAKEFARSQLSKNGTKIGKDDEKRKQAQNIFDGEVLRINKHIENSEYDEAKKEIEAVLSRLRDTNSDYAGHITLDDHIYNYKILDYYRKAANQEMTYEQLQRALQEMQGKPYIGNVDQNLAYLRNNPDTLNRMINQELAKRKNSTAEKTTLPQQQQNKIFSAGTGGYTLPTYNGHW